jgi:hypothetical protein
MVIAVVLTVVGTVSNSSGVAIMIQQQKLQQQTAYAATKGTYFGSSGDGISLDSGGDNTSTGLVNSTQSGSNNNSTSGISLGDDTGGDNNSCRRERGGELGARAGELGLSSKFCN